MKLSMRKYCFRRERWKQTFLTALSSFSLLLLASQHRASIAQLARSPFVSPLVLPPVRRSISQHRALDERIGRQRRSGSGWGGRGKRRQRDVPAGVGPAGVHVPAAGRPTALETMGQQVARREEEAAAEPARRTRQVSRPEGDSHTHDTDDTCSSAGQPDTRWTSAPLTGPSPASLCQCVGSVRFFVRRFRVGRRRLERRDDLRRRVAVRPALERVERHADDGGHAARTLRTVGHLSPDRTAHRDVRRPADTHLVLARRMDARLQSVARARANERTQHCHR